MESNFIRIEEHEELSENCVDLPRICNYNVVKDYSEN